MGNLRFCGYRPQGGGTETACLRYNGIAYRRGLSRPARNPAGRGTDRDRPPRKEKVPAMATSAAALAFDDDALPALELVEDRRRFSCILWDCDGTLLDTIADLAAAGNHVCEEHGWPTFSVDEYKLKVGNGQRVLVTRFMPAELAGNETLVEETYQEFCAYYAAHKEDRTAPYPGIADTLKALAARGVRMGVLTNKNQAESEELVARYFGDLLPVVQGRTDDLPAKPEPPMTRALMQRLGADPRATLMVGDTKVDIACGTNVGIATCGVLWGFRDRVELEAAGADSIVERPEEIAALVLG